MPQPPFSMETASKKLTRAITNHRVQKLWNRSHRPEEDLRNWCRNLRRDHATKDAGHETLRELLTVSILDDASSC